MVELSLASKVTGLSCAFGVAWPASCGLTPANAGASADSASADGGSASRLTFNPAVDAPAEATGPAIRPASGAAAAPEAALLAALPTAPVGVALAILLSIGARDRARVLTRSCGSVSCALV